MASHLGISRPSIDPNRLSAENIRFITDWLQHEGPISRRQYIPTRLLDLAPTDQAPPTPQLDTEDASFPDPVLVDTRQTPLTSFQDQAVPYVALSYCWGSSGPPLKTEKHTLAERLRGIPIQSMPLCFQDAIKVVRALGLRYIWIDALCIIQDDAVDWQREAGSMFDIFHNSFVTLGVAATSSCHESFLAKALPRFHIRFQSTTNPEISGIFSLHAAPPSEIPEVGSNWGRPLSPFDGDMFASEWNRRGWVWQEQNMTPMLLMFGESMIHLRGAGVHSEDGSNSGSLHLISNLGSRTDDTKTDDTELESDWYSWMRKYSQRTLTYPQDRLPAVSGLAKWFTKTFRREHPYYAGHWHSKVNFWRSLFWTAESPHTSFSELITSLTAPEGFTAPSWSWASRMSIVHWENIHFFTPHSLEYGKYSYSATTSLDDREDEETHLHHCSILSCDIVPVGVDPTGAVKQGKLVVQGRLKPIPSLPTSGEYLAAMNSKAHKWTWRLPSSTEMQQIFCTLDWIPSGFRPSSIAEMDDIFNDNDDGDDSYNTNNVSGDPDPNDPQLQLHMLLMGIDFRKTRQDYDEEYWGRRRYRRYSLRGLLLFPHPSGDSDVYVRVGIFQISQKYFKGDDSPEFFDDVEDRVVAIV